MSRLRTISETILALERRVQSACGQGMAQVDHPTRCSNNHKPHPPLDNGWRTPPCPARLLFLELWLSCSFCAVLTIVPPPFQRSNIFGLCSPPRSPLRSQLAALEQVDRAEIYREICRVESGGTRSSSWPITYQWMSISRFFHSLLLPWATGRNSFANSLQSCQRI